MPIFVASANGFCGYRVQKRLWSIWLESSLLRTELSAICRKTGTNFEPAYVESGRLCGRDAADGVLKIWNPAPYLQVTPAGEMISPLDLAHHRPYEVLVLARAQPEKRKSAESASPTKVLVCFFLRFCCRQHAVYILLQSGRISDDQC